MASAKKIDEGNECIREAEKHLKTSLFKWKPDYDSAANEYSKAATCFKTVKAYEQCKDALMRAADCYAKNRSYFSAAKSYEQAAFVCKDMEDYPTVIHLIQRACQLFREHGTPDTAAIVLEKGAKMVENKLPDRAIDLYNKAAEVAMLEDRPRQAAEYLCKSSRLLLKYRRYDEAAENMTREYEYNLQGDNPAAAGRLIVALVLVHLTREDYVAASKIYKEGGGYVEREETMVLNSLLDGYDQGDAEQMYYALNHPFIKHMDVEYAKLARCLQASCMSNQSTTKAQDSAVTEVGGSQDDRHSDEEFSGGLL
ncbi:gamma-soluble NSF attachment protein-like [Centruroides sculpturatus]|uniref:gamma-soluble NSF attachment protein-like n=1 Tax=Centruroides sculpturatus TaxID=218467 RepID=UPI000C6CBFF4|nr:gamma-soluble NSF attachment protein-like [Centruroides sculpturatus]